MFFPVCIKQDKTIFKIEHRENGEVCLDICDQIDKENWLPRYRERFEIEREASDGRLNLNPAILKSFGSLKIIYKSKNKSMKKGQRCILRTGYMISLSSDLKFKFIDERDMAVAIFPLEVKNNYWIGNILGKGVNGYVRQVHDYRTFEKFAIKTLEKQKEVDIIRQLDHPNLLRFVKAFISDEKVFLVTELMNCGNLKTSLPRSPYNSPLETEVKIAMFDVARGLDHLHSMNIAHLDIKPANILAHQRGNETIYKICDFGMSCLDIDGSLTTTGGTRGYFPPECFVRPSLPYSGKKRDMWSMGVVIFSCLFKRLPFSPLKPVRSNFSISLKEKKNVTELVYQLLENLLVFEPNNRLTTGEMLEHDWFNDSKIKRRDCRLRRVREAEAAVDGLLTALEPIAKRLRVR